MNSPQVPAARHTLDILRLLSTIDVPISAARIHRELGIPRSTTYHLLAEMVEAGFVVHLAGERTYGLGLAAYSMASAYTTQQPLVRLSQKYLEKIASFAGGSGHLSRLSATEIVYLQETRAARAVSLISQVGVRLPAVGTASGRAMLAHLPETEYRAVYSASDATEGWGGFQKHLADVRQCGFDVEVEEVSRGQASVAVAVLDHLQRPAAALAVTYPVNSLSEEQFSELCHLLQGSAREISARMYGNHSR